MWPPTRSRHARRTAAFGAVTVETAGPAEEQDLFDAHRQSLTLINDVWVGSGFLARWAESRITDVAPMCRQLCALLSLSQSLCLIVRGHVQPVLFWFVGRVFC
jgi:hypothetical protein